MNWVAFRVDIFCLLSWLEVYLVACQKFMWVGGVGSPQLCGHTNIVLGWSWAVTILPYVDHRLLSKGAVEKRYLQKTMFDAIHEHSLLLQFVILTDILRVSGGQNREFVVITYLLQQPMTNSRHYWSERGVCTAVRQTK